MKRFFPLMLIMCLAVSLAFAPTMTQAAPATAQEWMEQAFVDAQNNNLDQAIVSLDKSIKLDSKNPRAYLLRGELQLLKQKDKLAEQDFKRAIEVNDNKAAATLAVAKLYLQHGKAAVSEQYANNALALNPNMAPAYAIRSYIRLVTQNLNGAQADIDKAIELDPKYFGSYLLRAEISLAGNNPGQAETDFRQVVNMADEKNKAQANLAVADLYFRYSQPQQAIAYATASLTKEKSVGAYLLRGNANFVTKQYDKALADTNQALKLDANHAQGYKNRAIIYMQLQQPDKAKADFQKAVSLNPSLGNDIPKEWM